MPRATTLLRLAPLFFVLSIMSIGALGVMGAWATSEFSFSGKVLLWMLPAIVGAALFAIYGTAHLQSSLARTGSLWSDGFPWRQGRIVTLAFAIFVVTASLNSYIYVHDVLSTNKQRVLQQQESIAALKVQQIRKWLLERALGGRELGAALQQLPLDDPNWADRNRTVVEILFGEWLARHPENVGVTLFGPDGRTLMALGESTGEYAASADPRRIRERSLLGNGQLRLDFRMPLSRFGAQAALATLVFTVDPSAELLEEVERWPVPSGSSEVVIVRREGGNAVFVRPPLHMAEGGNRSIFSLSADTEIAAVQAVLRGEGVREARDYRGKEVLTAARYIDELGWYVIAKTDTAELYLPLERRAQIVTWLTVAAIVIAAAISVGLWQADRASSRIELPKLSPASAAKSK